MSVSLSVAELLERLGSFVPIGTLTVAVLSKGPVGKPTTIASTVYVTEVPGGRSTIASLMFPAPVGLQDAPATAEQLQVTLVRFVDKVPVTVASIAPEGPTGFETTTKYCMKAPASYSVTLSVIVICKSACGSGV